MFFKLQCTKVKEYSSFGWYILKSSLRCLYSLVSKLCWITPFSDCLCEGVGRQPLNSMCGRPSQVRCSSGPRVQIHTQLPSSPPSLLTYPASQRHLHLTSSDPGNQSPTLASSLLPSYHLCIPMHVSPSWRSYIFPPVLWAPFLHDQQSP